MALPSARVARRAGAALAAALAAGAALWLRGGTPAEPALLERAAPPERIVLIVIDTLRRDHLSVYGAAVATPALDALAARGQALRSAFASFHQTSMSMGALFTGRTPSIESLDPKRPLVWSGATWCGLARFAAELVPAECVPSELTTLAERLREAGYWTIGIASNELLYEPSGFSAGFDDWVEVGRTGGPLPEAEVLQDAQRAVWRLVGGRRVNAAALSALARRPRDRFLLYVHYMDVHDYKFRRIPYARAVAQADAAVGSLLARLEAEGLLRDALVIATADHGENLGESHAVKGGRNHLGNPSYGEVLAVPLVIAPPLLADAVPLLRSQDLYGLVLRAAGLDPGPAPELRPGELFLGEEKYRTYQRGRYKSTMRRGDGSFHLFDLEQDPGETRDVVAERPELRREHLIRMGALTGELRTLREPAGAPSPQDRERLRVLGYLDE